MLRSSIFYQADHDEMFLSEETDRLCAAFTDLLEGKIHTSREVIMIEPDFSFVLFPRADTGKHHPSNDIQDVHAQWRIHFWHEGLTDHYLAITLKRDDLTALRDFFAAIIQTAQ